MSFSISATLPSNMFKLFSILFFKIAHIFTLRSSCCNFSTSAMYSRGGGSLYDVPSWFWSALTSAWQLNNSLSVNIYNRMKHHHKNYIKQTPTGSAGRVSWLRAIREYGWLVIF